MGVPVLFVIFNRKSVASESMKAIRKVKPPKLYIAADGPRLHVENECSKVEETRDCILQQIDWECEVKTLFQDSNLGCQKNMFTAISWLFDNEEEGIILEDDCIADPSFFEFCQEMLNLYRNDSRIGMIAGSNLLADYYHPSSSYIFSNYKSCWGWATWRRAWQNMNLNLQWSHNDFISVLNNCGRRGKDVDQWKFKVRGIRKNHVSAWDWQWYLSLAAQNQMCIYPAFNLISNIGFGENATHTSWISETKTSKSLPTPYRAPEIVAPDFMFEELFYKRSNRIRMKLSRAVPYSIKKYLKKLLSK